MKAAIVALALAAGACAPLESDRRAIVGGELDTGDPAVVALIDRRTRCAQQDLTPLCTGTLIAPRVVLTAAHCLEVFGADGQYEVLFGGQVSASAEVAFSVVVAAQAHPLFDPATHAYDVALLRLAEPVTTPPIPLVAAPLAPPVVGAAARVVGFGETRDSAQPAGFKRWGQTVVTELSAASFRTAASPGMTCTGDSGGPVLLQLDGRERLAGVTASGDFACRSYAQNVRVDAVLESFIQPFLAETDSAPGFSASALAPAELCTAPCERAQDCPAGLSCVKGEDGEGQCMLPALQAGSFGKGCADDAQCGAGEVCGRLLPDDCRCFRPCVAQAAAGCSTAGGALTSAIGLLLATTLLARGARRSSRATGSRACSSPSSGDRAPRG